MPDLFSMFDEPEPAKPAPRVRVERPTPPPAAPWEPEDESARLNALTPCRTPYAGVHACRVSGGHAMFSDDGEKTFFCGLHAPHGFFAKDRKAGTR